MADKAKVPGTKDTTVKPNREQRRHPEKFERQPDQDAPLARDDGLTSQDVPPAGHDKKTADKWNQ